MHVVLLGPQGSGKGTQAKHIAKSFGLVHIETGALIRAVSRERSVLGKRIYQIINVEGKLIPDKIVGQILLRALQRVSKSKGIIFDGFPRTLAQVGLLERLLKKEKRTLTHVLYLPISQKTTIKRLSLRRVCKTCGTPWIIGKTLPRAKVTCSKCGGRVIHRPDDKPVTIKKRLAEYLRKTKPIISWYRKNHIIYTVNGERPIPVVWKRVKKLLA